MAVFSFLVDPDRMYLHYCRIISIIQIDEAFRLLSHVDESVYLQTLFLLIPYTIDRILSSCIRCLVCSFLSNISYMHVTVLL
jgi:hypothetical protein